MAERADLDDLDREEMEEFMRHMDANEDPEFLQYSALQLMCFDNFNIFCQPCECHGFQLLNNTVSVHTMGPSSLVSYLWTALELAELPLGTYVVSSWVASMFYDFAPIFLNREINGVRVLLINVLQETKLEFLRAVARLLDIGVLPCVYIRKVYVMAEDSTMILFSEPWFSEAIGLHLYRERHELSQLSST